MRKRFFAVLFLILTLVSSIAAGSRCRMLPSVDDERTIIFSCVQATLDDLTDLYKETEWIEFSVSKLPYIPARAFADFALRKLFFFNCDIRYIDPNAFQGLGQLESLFFYGSHINVIKAAWFEGLRSLTHLSLKKNSIVYIEPQLFLEIQNLEILNIEDNELDCLPEHSLAPLRKLRSLQIGKNPWLCTCYAELLRWMVNRNINLKEEEHSEYECMVEYDTRVNQLGSRSYTREWMMSNNKGLIEMYKNFSTSANDPSATCTSILSHIPNDVDSIQLSGITIPTIPNFAFFRFGNSLRSLNITDCHVTDIAIEAFAGLPKLEQLILYDNVITTVKHQWFRNLRVLKHLELDRNRIQRIETSVFVMLDKLETLSLNHNEIECLSTDSFSLLRNLKRVNIADNPWICECLEDFQMWLVRKQIGHETSAGGCTEGKAKGSEHRYGSESGNNSTGQMFARKSTEINHQNVEGKNSRTETEHERHEIISSSEYYMNSTQQQQQYSQRVTVEETIRQQGQHMQQQQQQQQQHSQHLTQQETITQHGQNIIPQQQRQYPQHLPQEETISQHGQNISPQQQQQYPQHLTQEETLSQHGQNISPQQQHQFFQDVTHEETISQHGQTITQQQQQQQQFDFATVQGNSHSIGQIQQTQSLNRPQVDCTSSTSSNNHINCTYVGGNLSMLDDIPEAVERIEILNSTIPELPANIFARFKNLKKLVLYNCGIRKINQSAFDGLPKLESLILSDNNIPIIKSAWFNKLNTLTELRLTRNSITDIELEVFKNLPNLKVLSLQDNSIKCIYTNSINSLDKLEEVSFENNPWKWRCVRELTQFLEGRNIRYTKFETYQGKPILFDMREINSIPNEMNKDNGTTNTSISTVNVICVSIAMLIFTKI